MHKVSEHVYAETGYIGSNVGCIVTEQGLITVDCPMLPQEIADWREKLARISDKEIAYAISTDHHFDHSITAGLFCSRIIAHRIAYRGMKYFQNKENLKEVFRQSFPKGYDDNRQFFEALDIALPQVVFSNTMTLNMGDCTIELNHLGGHSAATIMATVLEDRVAFLGDNVEQGNYPYTGEIRFGAYIDILEKVEQMDIETIVPGHGEVCGKEEARILRAYFVEMRDRVKELHKAGLKKGEVVEKVKMNVPASWVKSPGMDYSVQVNSDIDRMYEQVEKGLV